MLIDWFTVAAQALNFAILVWLMKRFLYKPVLDAIDAREKHVAAELAGADATKTEALRERDAFQQKNAAFDLQRAQLLTRATDEANAERERLLGEAAVTAAATAARRREALDGEVAASRDAIGLRTRQEVIAIAREVLADLATVELEEQVCTNFIERMRALDGQPREQFSEAVRTGRGNALIRSAFELPQVQRSAIGRALNETFSAEIALRFETAADLVAGIEVALNGQKLDWNIAYYIASLGKRVEALVDLPTAAATTAACAS